VTQLRAVVEHDPQPIAILDAYDRIVLANAACASLLESRPEYLLGAPFFGFVGRLDPRPRATSVLERAEDGCDYERLVLTGGRTVTASVTLLFGEDNRPTHVCLRPQEPAYPAVAPSLASLSRLAGQLAHDVNNQLAAALNYIAILRRRLDGVEPLASHLDELHAATWRAAALTTGWRNLTPAQPPEQPLVELGTVMEALEPLLVHAAPQVTLDIAIGADLAPLHAPLAQVEQIVLATALWSLRHGAPGSAVLVRARPLAGGTRLSFERTESSGRVSELGRTRAPVERGLRRALKRCRARLHHDAHTVFVDFQG
jgi:hypothetical protein